MGTPADQGLATDSSHHLAYQNLYADAAVGNPLGGHHLAEPSALADPVAERGNHARGTHGRGIPARHPPGTTAPGRL
ncbi:hypothetical protein GCM10011579_078240 [Streptomyces albiflavescens]|uniref:Uncharacterized protein n=1 Tax=Streptomyces albiflavescens TaxID=1623582 RepID=A0A917YDX3_9ACTN|nr:hypothetical protein GCM10011579_078240 [Streptomyces albiflavescens]